MADGEGSPRLRIRMYDIGFGDCFLLYVPDGADTRLVLVDFGRHINSSAGNTLSTVGKDLTKEAKALADGTPRFDVVVATHRHFDHIAGFDLSAAKKFHAGEVWLPWTENPDDPVAVDLKTRQFELARALGLALDGPGFVEESQKFGPLLANSHPDTVSFGLSNSGAMANLLAGLANAAERKFLPERPAEAPLGEHQEPGPPPVVQTLTTPNLPGVEVHVLGPSHDPDVIASLKPPEGEYYELVRGQLVAKTVPRKGSLFGDEYRLAGRARSSRSDETAFSELRNRAFDVAYGAKTLEDMVNGTSLVIVLEIGEAVVVLGGDAEWGTWEKILDDPEARALLARTTVYKVSHHGSYNGTPRRYVQELMPENAVSLVSLCQMDMWPSIPRGSLLTDLGAKKRQLVRTDVPAAGGVVVDRTELYTEIAVPV